MDFKRARCGLKIKMRIDKLLSNEPYSSEKIDPGIQGKVKCNI